MITERCGCVSASSGVSRPLRTRSATSEWSSVSCSSSPFADPVRPRVADVPDRDAALVDERRRDRRPHAGRARVLARAVVDPPVRLLDDRGHALRGLEVVGLVELAERRRREPRGDLARLRPAHPVGDDEERRLDDERVLVPAPAAAGVAQARLRSPILIARGGAPFARPARRRRPAGAAARSAARRSRTCRSSSRGRRSRRRRARTRPARGGRRRSRRFGSGDELSSARPSVIGTGPTSRPEPFSSDGLERTSAWTARPRVRRRR